MRYVCICLAAGTAYGQSFTDVTDEAGVETFQNSSSFSHEGYVGGGAIGDFDNDGWQDLFVIKGDGRDRLFINNQDGTFTDIGESAGMLEHRGKGAVTGDVNADGWLDIYVTSAGHYPGGVGPGDHVLYRNNGDGTFTNIAVEAGVNQTANIEDGFGAAFGDYDLDGDLDLFVAGFATNNSGSRLFRNNGDETFTDVTPESQIFQGIPGMSAFTPRFVDMDLDFYPEMPLISDFGSSRAFRNNTNGTYTDMTLSSGLGQEENGMGGNIGDFNNDGLIDLYVSSIYRPDIGWTGNKLYINQGDLTFDEISADAGTDDGGYGWGVVCVDFDHDGWTDILETNGGSGAFSNEQCYLFINEGQGDAFDERAIESGITHNDQGRGLVTFDYDNDGDMDVVIFANDDFITMYRNDGPDGASLRVFLDTAASPGIAPGGEGARVYAAATIGGEAVELFRLMSWGSNFESSSETGVHFGLGDASIIDQVRVEWPDGNITTLDDVAINQTITIASACPGDFNQDGEKNILDFVAFQGAFVDGLDTADCDENGSLDILDFVCFQGAFQQACE